MLRQDGNSLLFRYDAEQLCIEPWGPNALRIRATKTNKMPSEDWALSQPIPSLTSTIAVSDSNSTLSNGKIKAIISKNGKLMIYNSAGKLLLEEYARNRRDLLDPKCSAIEVEAREFKPIPGGDYHLITRFESVDPDERIYGMGQYQQPFLNLKGMDLELAHRNSQASVPFALSSLGYGFLWNNPGIGRCVLGKNVMSFEAYSTKVMDYWIVAGDGPSEIVESYSGVSGRVPMMPEYGLGFWQCKLRYQTQEELLGVAREYRRLELPIDLIVIDFFHWAKQGDWRFDPVYWPNPEAMISELKSLKIELMVSIWPTVESGSENYISMLEAGHLIRVDRGVRTGLDFQGQTIHFDATNPSAREFIWSVIKKNYFDKGIRVFWLDEAEPEYTAYDFDNFRYWLGSNLQIGNIFPVDYARTFYEGQLASGQSNIVNLIRCAWAGSQRFGTLVWSGDIASSWGSLRNQLAAGLNMGLAGIPWWTTDIGGFHGGDPNDEAFRELFVRWFQWGAFCPVMRLHGDREPRQPVQGETGGAINASGAANEVWSYGKGVLEICRKYMGMREGLREYTRGLMQEASKLGRPLMRPCFYDFPEDKSCWEVEDQYMFGPKYLVAPVLYPGMRKRVVYLPSGSKWKFNEKEDYDGEQVVEVDCPIESMPVFEKLG